MPTPAARVKLVQQRSRATSEGLPSGGPRSRPSLVGWRLPDHGSLTAAGPRDAQALGIIRDDLDPVALGRQICVP
jgi:hypothetical protein